VARRKGYIIHDKPFRTQEELKQHIQRMMAKYRDNEILDPEDRAFLLKFVQLHPHAPEKIGAGIAQFTIRHAPPWFRNRAFYIIRVVGPDVEFSFMECLRPSSQKQRFRNACRTAISRDIVDFVETSFEARSIWRCPLTGAPVTRDSYEVDHEPQFVDLVSRFVTEYKIDESAVDIGGDGDHETRDYFRDSTLSMHFAEFHRTHGKLRLVTPEANRKRPRTRR
jgi:hypothetical protein